MVLLHLLFLGVEMHVHRPGHHLTLGPWNPFTAFGGVVS